MRDSRGIMMESTGRFPLAAWLGVFVVGVFSAAPAGATTINGDFEALPDPLASWQAITFGGAGASVGTVGAYGGYVSTIAQLHAETTYTWDAGQGLWTGDLTQAALQQGFFTPYWITVGANESALRFDAAAVVSGEGALDPTVTVMALTGGGGATAVTSPAWSTYQFDLTGPGGSPLAPGTPINVALFVGTSPPARVGAYDAEQVTQVVDLYADNVQNTGVIPEPCSAAATAMLVVGWAAAALRRRRFASVPADA